MAKRKMAKATRRQPTDATMRNVRAARKRVNELAEQVANLALAITETNRRVTALEHRRSEQP